MKLVRLIQYLFQFIFLVIIKRPAYLLYNISFDKMPFLKDFLFCWMGRIFGCRLILHDMGQYLKELYHSSNRFYQWLIKKLINMTTAHIVLGEKVRDDYKELVQEDRIFAVHGSVEDTRQLITNKRQSRRENSKNDKINVLYFSFLSVSKGLFTALSAIPEVIQKNRDIIFTFAGPVETSAVNEEMNRFISEHSLESYVDYLGYIEDEHKRTELFRKADIFIFPTHRDVFGLVLLHAMAESVPVVASIEGAIPEIVENGKSGLLFTKGDHRELAENILTLAGDAQLRKRIGAEGRNRYLKLYTPEQYGQRMIETFSKIQQLSER